MSLEKRPYVGTWTLNNQQLVQHTPDALVYVNGDTSVPGCAKCNGKINLQKFITEVSVDGGTEPGSASATMSLSIPLHHTDSFARDAKFILRPGLEVHVYMRGYFPVKGLYANLAEAQSKSTLSASAETTQATAKPARSPKSKEPRKPDGSTYQRSDLGDPTKWTSSQKAEADTTLAMMQTMHQYLTQQGFDGVEIQIVPNGGVSDHGHVENSAHYSGKAVDPKIYYRNSRGERVEVPKSIQWGSVRKLQDTGYFPPGGVGMYLKANQRPNANPVWTGAVHFDSAGKRAWVWMGGNPLSGAEKRAWLKAMEYNIEDKPAPDRSVNTWKANLAGEYFDEPEVTKGFQSPQIDPNTGEPVTGIASPSLLEELGLSGQGIEDALAYPYYHVFHGVMTEVNHSYSGGVSSISINCASMLHFWQYHNMSTNASAFGARPTNSKNKMSLVGNNFTGMHPYAIMYSLHYDMAGAAGGIGYALSAKSNQSTVTQGNESLFSLNVRYWEQRFRKGTKLRMHGATGDLFSTMAAAWLSRKSSGALSGALRARYNSPKSFSGTKIGEEMALTGLFAGKNRRNAIDATKFADLSKPGAGKNAYKFQINILEMQAFVSNIGDWGQVNLFESTYESKLDIANKVCEITGFEFYQDVDGDFVFKPPMWNLDTSSSRVYRIEDIDIINIAFSEKEPQVTYMTVKGSHFKNIQGTGLENEWGVRGQYIDYRLVAQFGWRPGSYETNYFNDPKSMFFAAVNRMDVMNVGVSSASVTIPVRPELRPGYPVYIPFLDCFYYCNSFSHSHSTGGQCTTTLQLVGKRAKFYAPGETSSGRSGISAIKLGDTKLPERPLGVLGQDGKPRMSGFPNVVMALDPTAINPLFFVVGTDIENISDPRVVKYLLQTAVDQGIIYEEPIQAGDSRKSYSMRRTTVKPDASTDGESTEVRFFFDENDLQQDTVSGSNVNIMAAAVRYQKLLAASSKQDTETLTSQAQTQGQINNIYAQIAEIRRNPEYATESSQGAALIRQVEALQQKALNLTKSLEQSVVVSQAAKTALEDSWRDPKTGGGVSVLLQVLEQTSEAYRSSANFQGREDLSSTINLLDMLSDKKATFSNGQQPGQYRYYSASHPDVKDQGPPSIQYDGSKKVIVDGPPASILPREEGQQPPTVSMYHKYPTAPYAGAAIPEAELRPGVPQAGIRILTGNPKKPRGEVLATSEITEIGFTVQDVSVVKNVTSASTRSLVSGVGRVAERSIAHLLEVASASPSDTIQSVYERSWASLKSKGQAGLDAMVSAAESSSPPVDLVVSGSFFDFPSIISVGRSQVDSSKSLDHYKFQGSDGTVELGQSISNKPIAVFLQALTRALSRVFRLQVQQLLREADRLLSESPKDTREAVISAFNTGLAIGTPSRSTSKGLITKVLSKSEQTYSPVFPVSDSKGYNVVGSYRYGRGVDIDPNGVFDQLHKHDIFSLLDKDLVDQILRTFVQGDWHKIKVPAMKEVPLGNGKKKVVPITEAPKSAADAAKYLNEEALRQLRAANLSDKQILDFSPALQKGTAPNQLDFSLANYFADTKLDGLQKVPVINAAYSLADLNFQQAGHVCDCKAAEANVLISAFGQEQFVSLAQAGNPAHEGLGSDPSDAATRWVATQSGLAAAQWETQQQALRGQVLDASGSHVVSRTAEAFGIDTPGQERDSLFDRGDDQVERARLRVLQEKSRADAQIHNLSDDSGEVS